MAKRAELGSIKPDRPDTTSYTPTNNVLTPGFASLYKRRPFSRRMRLAGQLAAVAPTTALRVPVITKVVGFCEVVYL